MVEISDGQLTVDLREQTAIVTGASRGLGRAIAIGLARAGAKVACIARDTAKLAETVAEITAADGTAQAFECDVTSTRACKRRSTQCLKPGRSYTFWSTTRASRRDTLIPRMQDEQWDEVINTNLRGAFLVHTRRHPPHDARALWADREHGQRLGTDGQSRAV